MVSLRPKRKHFLQNLSVLLFLVIAIIVVTATELTIRWNNIQGVNILGSAGQTIPFVIGVCSFVRILYVYVFKTPDPADEQQGSSHRSEESPMDITRAPMRARRPSRGHSRDRRVRGRRVRGRRSRERREGPQTPP
jgi:hypothetical protein